MFDLETQAWTAVLRKNPVKDPTTNAPSAELVVTSLARAPMPTKYAVPRGSHSRLGFVPADSRHLKEWPQQRPCAAR